MERAELSDDTRGRIVGAHLVGASIRKISEQLGVPKSTVSKTIIRFKRTGSAAVAPRTGRPRILSDRDARALRRNVEKNRKASLAQITDELKSQANVAISLSTVRTELHRMGICSRYARKKPWISSARAKERISWCKERESWDIEWQKIIWSDESRFQLFFADGRQRIWRRTGEAFSRDCVLPTVKHGGGSVMVWACMGWFGAGPLIIVEGNMKSEDYVGILSEHLLPIMEQQEGLVFQHDGAPIHKSKITSEWLEENDISVLPWVDQSPDLNPIQHLWDQVDRKIREMDHLPTSRQELENAIKIVWNDISVSTVRDLIRSMPRRVEAVLHSKGYSTRY